MYTISLSRYYLFDKAGKPFILVVNGLPCRQRIISKLILRELSAKISFVFTDEVSSASTGIVLAEETSF
jgi:hypothetical protein